MIPALIHNHPFRYDKVIVEDLNTGRRTDPVRKSGLDRNRTLNTASKIHSIVIIESPLPDRTPPSCTPRPDTSQIAEPRDLQFASVLGVKPYSGYFSRMILELLKSKRIVYGRKSISGKAHLLQLPNNV